MARYRLLDLEDMLIQEIADTGTDKIRTVGLQTYLDEQVNLA
jgi:hypothetical protein